MKPIKLVLKHPVPSLNKLFAMNPWQRKKEKQKTQVAFHGALLRSQATEDDYLTLITLREAASIFWIAVNTASSYRTIAKKTSSLLSIKLE